MTTQANSKINVFKIFEDCITKRSHGTLDQDPEFESAMSNFMLCRIFRMHDFLMPVALRLERYQTVLSKSDFYHLAYSVSPRRARAPYSDFIRKKKKVEPDRGQTSADVEDDGFALI